jgi:hypothetical protein
LQEAIIAGAFLVVAALLGMFIKPNEAQLRPLTPQASSGDAGHDAHHHGHDAHHH